MNYIDQLNHPGGKQFNIQNFMMMYIFASNTNTDYRTNDQNQWPTSNQYLQDFNECKAFMGYRYPETPVQEFLTLNVPKDAKILVMACRPGNVAFIVSTRNISKCCDIR